MIASEQIGLVIHLVYKGQTHMLRPEQEKLHIRCFYRVVFFNTKCNNYTKKTG